MPIIDHSTQPMPAPVDKRSSRSLVSSQHGATALTIQEVVVHPGGGERLHTHPTDEAVMITEGSVQLFVGDEVRTVRSGYTMLAPRGIPHRVVNNTWVAAKMLVICPPDRLETDFVE